MSSEVYVLSAVRTPIGRFGGSLKDTSAAHLGAHAMKASIDRASVDPGSLDLVAFGNVLRAGQGQLIPRQSAFEAGIPDHVDAVAVDMVCSSGMMSMMVASMAIRSGEADLVLAGGTESMSGTGFYISDDARWGLKYGGQPLVDILAHDGLTDPFSGEAMGVQTERLAAERGVTRAELDSIAYESHARAAHAQGSGAFANELAPIQYRSRRDTLTLEHDEGVRADTSVDALANLRPAFTPEGVLTAGNSSQISDGAAAVMLASGKWVKENNAKPIARITASSWAAGRTIQVSGGADPGDQAGPGQDGDQSGALRPVREQRGICAEQRSAQPNAQRPARAVECQRRRYCSGAPNRLLRDANRSHTDSRATQPRA